MPSSHFLHTISGQSVLGVFSDVNATATAALEAGSRALWQSIDSGSFATGVQQFELQALETGSMLLNVTREHQHPEDYDLFREEDLVSWIVFFIIFIVLLIVDNFVLHGGDEDHLSFARATCYSLFWVGCAGAFNLYVYFARGPDDAFNWGTGYLLEWMLSVDNLFVFRSIFLTFKTPDTQKHKPLFWGIIGAIFFRMIFFAVEELLLHFFSFMYVVLGVFLAYTGVKIMVVEDDEEISQEGPIIRKIKERLPYVNTYAPRPCFFARVEELDLTQRSLSELSDWETPRTRFDVEQPLRATKLLVVVIFLELTDVIFAVDSVSAIVAQIPDLFLAYTACVFAMLGLRATFFVVDELVKLFSLLSYGVGLILIFIGVKLCLKGYVHVPHEIVCCVLMGTLATSIVASYVWENCLKKEEPEVTGKALEKIMECRSEEPTLDAK
mmetsp:Transcript_16023/g.34657  ORF Transcript_16023/g.34657 Transcript_16023/m.34657 type:complete len:440 (+) Transcript_16023:223-1542(+)|eukprot:CAMPEP_0206482124 /NCGR_PEP_ID=MMETSP0324_2-20121206/38667_1 /ASSEMBLY_ACC=CAM_ASM_000836 /TAXON_ID=2866 /ORGANISM="Crypthecodinium cohnii, Strain Seligo" /LENGTH=439 /DNA_ID=CAMNT_0053959971 /DNA_START=165 /DNA_END=1484 /DNA_ORIENTATION=+